MKKAYINLFIIIFVVCGALSVAVGDIDRAMLSCLMVLVMDVIGRMDQDDESPVAPASPKKGIDGQ